ncbi:MAG: pyrroline-5-carboxylate reductase [Clostridiaceae bacterium]
MKVGFIGFGNMAYAMAGGMIKYGGFDPADLMVSARDMDKLKSRANGLKIACTKDNRQVAAQSEILFLAVKPHFISQVIQEIADVLRPETTVVSVAAGISLAEMEECLGRPGKLIRALPNTPVLVGQGMTLYEANEQVTPAEEDAVVQLLEGFGKARRIDEALFAGTGSMTGCSPAFLYMLMEAMGDAAVRQGMSREAAYELAAQTVKGSAEMVLETKLHPGQLKDMVTSPGGTTIEGVRVLERLGFRSAIMEAIIAAAEKTKK